MSISEFQKEFTSKFKKRLMINDNSYLISMYNISVWLLIFSGKINNMMKKLIYVCDEPI